MFDPLSLGVGSTMPLAIPGAMAPGGTGNFAAPAPALPMPGQVPMSSPMGGPASFPSMPVDPGSIQYAAETQADGTILLRIKNPNGSLGPVVQLISQPKQSKGQK